MVVFLIFISAIWPLGAFFWGIKNFRKRQYHILLFLFFVTGAFLIIPYEYGDIMGYIQRMDIFDGYSFSEFLAELGNSFIGKGNDGFENFLTINVYFVSRFTNNISYAFVLTSVVFYLFWIKIISSLYLEYQIAGTKNQNAIFLLVLFSVYIIFFRAINGRFYLAYWGFILATYQIINNKNKKYFLLSLSTIFIHQSFIFANIILGLFWLSKPIQKFRHFEAILILIIIAGTIYSEAGLTLISGNLDVLGESVEGKYRPYTEEGYITTWLARDRAWFQKYRGDILFYATVLSIFISRYKRNINLNSQTKKFYIFFLLFWAANAFTYNIASMGERFRNVLIGLGLMLLFKIYNSNFTKKIPVHFWVLLMAFMLYKVVTFRILAEYISIWLFAPFGILINFFAGEFSLFELFN